MEYSREGSKADGSNPSKAVLGIWACNVPVREHQASAVFFFVVLPSTPFARLQDGDTEYPLAGLPILLVLGDYSL